MDSNSMAVSCMQPFDNSKIPDKHIDAVDCVFSCINFATYKIMTLNTMTQPQISAVILTLSFRDLVMDGLMPQYLNFMSASGFGRSMPVNRAENT